VKLSGRQRDRAAAAVAPGRCKCCGHKLAVWTPETIVSALHTWADKNGRVPTAVDWATGTADHPAQTTVCTMFGTWNKGLNAAGLADRARMERDPVWTKDMIVAALLDFRVREGRWPSWREWAQAKGRRNRDRPASWSVVRAFGSWSAAIEFASGATDPSVATEHRALSSARRLAAVEPSLTKSAPAMRRDFAAPVTERDDELTLTQTAA